MTGNTKYKETILACFQKVANEDKSINWADVWEELTDVIVEDYNGQDDLKEFKYEWKDRIKKTSALYNYIFTRENNRNEWPSILSSIESKDFETEQQTSSSTKSSAFSSTKSSTSSLKYQKKLTAENKQQIETNYRKITNNWKLQSGKVVEDVVFECSKEYLFEHPSHSLIFNIKDSEWCDKFTDVEKAEIEKAGCTDLLKTPLPSNLSMILKNLNGKCTFNDIYDTFERIKANPIEEPEEYWVKKTVLDYINLFIDGDNTPVFNTEQDLLDEVYGFLKKSRRISKTKTENASGSPASSESKNRRRSIATISPEKRQVPCDHADLSFLYMSSEIGCIEIGLKDQGPNGTKELNEREIKLPKMLKGFFGRLLSQYSSQIKNAKVVGIIISGMFISAEVMSFDHGSISLVTVSKRFKMPESLSEIPGLLPPVIKLIYNCALIIKNTTDVIKSITLTVPEDGDSDESEDDSYFPPCFFPENSVNRKRKLYSLSSQ